MTGKFRWGICGTGNIAHAFARGLEALSDAELAAVGSRTAEAAARFGDEFGVPRRHASYEVLAADPDVDAVYVATPHPLHMENTVLFLRAGKAVLCEKPFAVNRKQAEEMVATARAERRFLMEAMWTRFLPMLAQVRSWLASGRIGEVRMVQADFGFRAGWDEESRLLDPLLAGGGLLDVGVYCVSLASMVYGREPSRIAGLAHLGRTRVDEQSAVVLGYDGGALALLSSAVRTNTPQEAIIMGTEGIIRLHPPFWRGSRATLTLDGKDEETFEFPMEGNGYNYEAAEVARCVREGRIESEIMPLNESLAIMGVMDGIRAQWGLVYPFEKS
ncbi:MAG TPA: Gfo/Idh/MocA family oxidoreductase [Candidatus Hydrogenedentes bacterium]|nr:Gfo/Idh/MocA family oxidoreductase [Candidatus Hydrogenedentota bacterium]